MIGEGNFCPYKHGSFVCFKPVFVPSSAVSYSTLRHDFSQQCFEKSPGFKRSAKDEGGYETKPERELFRKINLFIESITRYCHKIMSTSRFHRDSVIQTISSDSQAVSSNSLPLKTVSLEQLLSAAVRRALCSVSWPRASHCSRSGWSSASGQHPTPGGREMLDDSTNIVQ